MWGGSEGKGAPAGRIPYLGVTGVDRGVVVPALPCSIRLDVEPLLCMEVRLGSFVYLLPSAPGVSDRERWLPL